MKTKSILTIFILFVSLLFAVSCSSSDESNDTTTNGNDAGNGDTQITSITISTTSALELLERQSATFQVRDNLNNGVTNAATIYVNDQVIESSSYTFLTPGSYSVRATLNALESNVIVLDVVAASHTTKVLVEDYTGTWCGFCPRLAYNLEEAEALNPAVIGVGIHSGDVMETSYTSVLEAAYTVVAYPTGRVNRNIRWNESVEQPLSYLEDKQPLGLAINSSISGSTVNAELKVHYDLGTSDQHKLVVYLLEDGVLYDQTNYLNDDPDSPWYQAGNPIPNFEHNNVLRDIYTNALGDIIPSSSTVTGNVYMRNFSVTVPSSIQNINNLELVAFVIGANGRVINTQHAALGVNQDFD